MKAQSQSANFMPPPVVKAWQKRALTAAVPLTIAAILGWIISFLNPNHDQFYQAYLLGYMWVLGLPLGSLALLMIYHTTGGAWGTVIRRQLEAATRTLWVVAAGFVPLLLGVHRLYPWAQAEWLGAHPDAQHIASVFLNVRLVLLRAVIYFAAWIALSVWLNRVSDRQDRENASFDVPLRRVSGIGLVIYSLTLLFAAVDWVMSLSYPWSSTIFGLLFMVGQGLTALSFAVIILAALVKYEPMKSVVKPDQVLDHGKLLLAFTMLWGWFTLSQWLIIWAGNLPDEISWYLERSSPGWHAYAWFIVVGQFFLPFFILLSRTFKSRAQKLEKLALYLIFIRYCDLFWYIMPNFHQQHWAYSWQYAVVPLAMLSCWLVLYFYNLDRRPLLALQDDHVKLILESDHELERA